MPGEVSVAGVPSWRDMGMGVVINAQCFAYLWAIFSSFSKVEKGFQFLNQIRIVTVEVLTL